MSPICPLQSSARMFVIVVQIEACWCRAREILLFQPASDALVYSITEYTSFRGQDQAAPLHV